MADRGHVLRIGDHLVRGEDVQAIVRATWTVEFVQLDGESFDPRLLLNGESHSIPGALAGDGSESGEREDHGDLDGTTSRDDDLVRCSGLRAIGQRPHNAQNNTNSPCCNSLGKRWHFPPKGCEHRTETEEPGRGMIMA